MGTRFRLLLLIAAATGALLWTCDIASAQDADRKTCRSQTAPPDQVEAACARVLAGGALSDTDRAVILTDRCNAYDSGGEYDKAISDCNEAIRLRPEFPPAFYSRCLVYLVKGDYDKAISDCSEALRMTPEYPAALTKRGFAYSHKGEYDEAISDYNEAIRLKPDYPYAFNNRGVAYANQGEYDKAISDYNEAIRLKPDYPYAFNNRGNAYSKIGEDHKAISDYNEAKRLAAALPTPPAAASAPAQPMPATPPPATPAAPAGQHVALVVANGAYRDAPLANPGVDADLIKAGLERGGFKVTVKRDLPLDGFEQAIEEFADEAKGAEVALFYFAGHGFSLDSGGVQQNLLMATDANFQAKTGYALQSSGESLEHLQQVITGHAHATLIFIDACRNIPVVARRGLGGRGFAPIDASAFDGAFVVISTRQGKMADDGVAGQGSPFARAVAKILPTPDLRIEDAYYLIRDEVNAETSGAEVPDLIRSDLPKGGLVLARQKP
jgi:tetratricopeptide (TPR) repeat protein